MLEEKITHVFPSEIKNLNAEGWSVIQVIEADGRFHKQVKIRDIPETGPEVGIEYYKDECAYLCLLRRVENVKPKANITDDIDMKALCVELRNRTGDGLITCEWALLECECDLDKATQFLRDRDLAWKRG